MKKEDFSIGHEFYTASGKWRCTDIGTRVITAIQVDQVTASKHDGQGEPTTEIVTDDESWFNGPPYAVAEHVFDEYGFGGCSPDPDGFSEAAMQNEDDI